MSKRRIYIYSILLIIVLLAWVFTNSSKQHITFSESVKLALRDAGNELLLANHDSTSLVSPIIKLSPSKYQLTFKSQLHINPDSLVSIVQRSFNKVKLPMQYLVEVIQCVDQEVAYSFQIMDNIENDIVPCKGRILPRNCYRINVKFTNNVAVSLANRILIFTVIAIIIVFSINYFQYKQKENTHIESSVNKAFTFIGEYKFYPEQHKLIKEPVEISLSRKECELLAIFAENANQIVKREDLTKKVWEDNGVIVGRSLDTYISKLRKKLKDDSSIKLINVHGVGYKLEINNSIK